VGPIIERTSFEDLAAILLNDYRINRRKSYDRIEDAVNHLREIFADARALEITPDRIAAYIEVRQEADAANATINRELSALKRMFRLGLVAGKVDRPPHIQMLVEDNVRTGFCEKREFRALLRYWPDDLKGLFEFAYITGWRIKSELTTRQWRHIDFHAGWLRLEPGEAKNKEGRMFALTARLRAVLQRQREQTEALQRATGQIVPWVFHRDGKRIKSYRRAWLSACRKAGLPGLIPHDFRRTAIRNFERVGIPRSVAMKMVGHKTEDVYRRYAIADEAMLREAGTKLTALHQAERGRRSRRRAVIPTYAK
jgi:integrase